MWGFLTAQKIPSKRSFSHQAPSLTHDEMRRMTDTALARSSDDFWPRDVASHTTHVAINAGNSVFMAALVQPDWDMFQSLHPAALLHASARVVCTVPLMIAAG